jgi:hypothetical protein
MRYWNKTETPQQLRHRKIVSFRLFGYRFSLSKEDFRYYFGPHWHEPLYFWNKEWPWIPPISVASRYTSMTEGQVLDLDATIRVVQLYPQRFNDFITFDASMGLEMNMYCFPYYELLAAYDVD